MKRRGLVSLGLSAVLALSSIGVVCAKEITAPGESGTYGVDQEITGETKVPTIKIVVPTEGDIIVNPYGLSVEVGDAEVTDQIISAEQVIENYSDVPIAVDVTVTGTLGTDSEVVFATAALKGTETTKSVFAFMEMVAKADADTEGTYTGTYDKAKTPIVSAKPTTVKGIYTLPAAADESTPSLAGYKIIGQVATAPAKAWTDKDTMNVTVAFNFVPQVAKAEETP